MLHNMELAPAQALWGLHIYINILSKTKDFEFCLIFNPTPRPRKLEHTGEKKKKLKGNIVWGELICKQWSAFNSKQFQQIVPVVELTVFSICCTFKI